MTKQTPSWRKKSIRRYFVDRFLIDHVSQIPAQQLVLDLGGHKGRARGMFDIAAYPIEVVCVNITSEKGADIVADAAAVALQDNRFDVVVCAELLEHVPDPKPVLAEAWRLLKPGGRLLITVPFLFHIHADPHDFGRYTDHYWKNVLAQISFTEIKIERQGGYYAVMASHLEWYLKTFRPPRPFGRPTQWILTRLVANPAKRLALWLESFPAVINHPFQKRFTTGYEIVAVKDSQRTSGKK